MELLILAVIALLIMFWKDIQLIKLEEERDKWKRLYLDALNAIGDKHHGQKGQD